MVSSPLALNPYLRLVLAVEVVLVLVVCILPVANP
jgi:hypothetical protein